MKQNRIILTKNEATWLAKNVIKTKTILEAAAKKDPETLERKTYKNVCRLAADAADIQSALEAFKDEPFEFEFYPQKAVRTVTGDMIEASIKALEGTIIPEYKRRGAEYDTYLKEAEDKVGMLKVLRRKFK